MASRRGLLVTVAVAVPFVAGAVAQAGPDPSREPAPEVAFLVQDHRIAESSGLVAVEVDGEQLFVTVNDSGDDGRVFTIDPATGETVGTTVFTPRPRDVEALAPAGEGHVWVADIGDNRFARDHVTVTRVPVGRGDLDAGDGESHRLVHPERAADAEALVTHPETGRLYVITKQVLGGTVYAAPEVLEVDGDNVLEPIGQAPMLVTDASFTPDGRFVVMRGYDHAWVKSFPDLDVFADFALPRQPQGEGLAVASDWSVYLSTEGRERPVLRVDLPDEVLALAGLPVGDGFWATVARFLVAR